MRSGGDTPATRPRLWLGAGLASLYLVVVLGCRELSGLRVATQWGAEITPWARGLVVAYALDSPAWSWLLRFLVVCVIFTGVASRGGRAYRPKGAARLLRPGKGAEYSEYALRLFRQERSRAFLGAWLRAQAMTVYTGLQACIPAVSLTTRRDGDHLPAWRRELAFAFDHALGLALLLALTYGLSWAGHAAASRFIVAAAREGEASTVWTALALGYSPDLTSIGGTSALRAACAGGDVECARLLLDAGADPNAADPRGRTPLHRAISADATDVALLLINRGADVGAVDRDGYPVLYVAVRERLGEVARACVTHGADVNAVSGDGNTALTGATIDREEELVAYLLAHGADPNARGAGCPGPLHAAAHRDLVETARALLDAGAAANAQDGQGDTPLHVACRTGNAESARLLLEHGADPALANELGQTPRDVTVGDAAR
jgi:ankyrin repeat protein